MIKIIVPETITGLVPGDKSQYHFCKPLESMMGKSTVIPGVKASHKWITKECRENKGDIKCIEEVTSNAREILKGLMKGWDMDRNVRFHVAITVERETSEDEYIIGDPK